MSLTIAGITITTAALAHGARSLANSPEVQKAAEKTADFVGEAAERTVEFVSEHRDVAIEGAKFVGKVLWRCFNPFGLDVDIPVDPTDD